MDKYCLEFGRRKKRKNKIITKDSNVKKCAEVILVCGALFLAVFFSAKLNGHNIDEQLNHSFEAVYAMAQTDNSEAVDSVLTSSVEDGEWSLWLYLEYVLGKLFGEV